MAFPLRVVTEIPTIRVVDVGASPIDGTPPYAPLVQAGGVELIGFEPSPEQFAALQSRIGPGVTFLPCAVGDGADGVLNVCRAPGMTSLLEPDLEVLSAFHVLAECAEITERLPISTRRLDDIEEVQGADYLKLDVQGSELAILQNARRTLESVLVVQIEVNFVPFYKDQPLFAELDQELRAAGFYLHRFLPLVSRVFKPLLRNNDPYAGLSQILWTDAIYVKKFTELDELDDAGLLKAARILHEVYEGYDLAAKLLWTHDQRHGGSLYEAYLARFG